MRDATNEVQQDEEIGKIGSAPVMALDLTSELKLPEKRDFQKRAFCQGSRFPKSFSLDFSRETEAGTISQQVTLREKQHDQDKWQVKKHLVVFCLLSTIIIVWLTASCLPEVSCTLIQRSTTR